MEDTDIIKKAKEKLQPIKYKPELWGYFVKQDDVDMGDEDYCRKCIPRAVKEAKAYYFDFRKKIIRKYEEIENTGMFKDVQVKGVYSDEEIQRSKVSELEKYPLKVKFSFEGHDPDFGGGKTEPLCCPSCGKYFETNFLPDIEESKYLLDEYLNSKKLGNALKWKLDHVFFNYPHLDDKCKAVFLSIAKNILL